MKDLNIAFIHAKIIGECENPKEILKYPDTIQIQRAIGELYREEKLIYNNLYEILKRTK